MRVAFAEANEAGDADADTGEAGGGELLLEGGDGVDDIADDGVATAVVVGVDADGFIEQVAGAVDGCGAEVGAAEVYANSEFNHARSG